MDSKYWKFTLQQWQRHLKWFTDQILQKLMMHFWMKIFKKSMNTYLSISWIRDTPASLDTVNLVLFVVILTIALPLESPILPCQKKPRYKGTEGFLCSMRQGCVWSWSEIVQCTMYTLVWLHLAQFRYLNNLRMCCESCIYMYELFEWPDGEASFWQFFDLMEKI